MLLKVILPTFLSLATLDLFCDIDTVFLTLIFSVIHIIVSKLCAKVFSDKPLLGYPVWAYYASIFQQLIVLPPIAGMIIWRESNSLSEWMFSHDKILGKYCAYKDLLKTLSLITTASAMIKDYWTYGNNNQWGFILHHMITVFACAHCLAMPVYPGAVILVGIFAEFTSLFYNIRVLHPSKLNKLMHVVFMGLSNVLAIMLCRLMWVHAIDGSYLYWKLGFTFIVAMLSALRFSGFFLDV